MKGTSKKKPERSLLVSLKKTGGRNQRGRITVRHRGGGARKLWRRVDFAQEKLGVPGVIRAVEYDPNRNAFLALVEHEDGEMRYQLAAHGLKEGDSVLCAEEVEVNPGNRTRLKNLPVGTSVYAVELMPGSGGSIVRGAGAEAKVLAHEGGFVHLALPSSEIRKVSEQSFATVGMVSNPEFRYKNIGKAGSNRLKGWRPTVRGSAMNPVDHPHGGGEGRSGIGMKHPKTPWGKPALGVKTRKRKWTDKLIVKRRKKKKKK
ncbi:MAG: 50S ribosomal protein L2 [bacterium]|nr:50S ribosomal protein L2 [bacterium]MDZ4231839.1 50S ribosomal protein L2 [Candidatus Pacearchaeota archaeon]